MSGITSTVFTRVKNLIRTSIAIYVNTETFDPITGQKTDSFAGTATTVSGVFLRRNALKKQFEEGVLEEGDAYCLVETSVTINRNDRVTVNSKNYLVEDVVTRRWNGNALFKSCRLTFTGDAS